MAAERGVAGVEAVALGEHHPAARVEARGGGAGAPAGADGSEADIVEQVARRQHARRQQAHQILRRRRPARSAVVRGAAAVMCAAAGPRRRRHLE